MNPTFHTLAGATPEHQHSLLCARPFGSLNPPTQPLISVDLPLVKACGGFWPIVSNLKSLAKRAFGLTYILAIKSVTSRTDFITRHTCDGHAFQLHRHRYPSYFELLSLRQSCSIAQYFIKY
jgi:hypothetical protein